VKIAGAGIGIYLLYRFFLSEDDQSGGTTQDIEVNQNKLTYPLNQYEIWADGIEAAIWGTSFIGAWWEDDEAIYNTLLQMRTTDDVYQLIRAYGVRYVGVLFNSDGGNLVQMISEYLDDDYKTEVNAYYKLNRINFVWP
jgi:hypothetical protein